MPFNYTPDVVMSSKDMCCYTSIATDPTLLCPVVTEMSLKSCKDICCYPPLHLFPTHHPPAQCPVGRLSQCVTNHVPTKSSKSLPSSRFRSAYVHWSRRCIQKRISQSGDVLEREHHIIHIFCLSYNPQSHHIAFNLWTSERTEEVGEAKEEEVGVAEEEEDGSKCFE
nr:hypothetical protein BgiMline_005259 [Biomphalaria glabrata]